MSFGKQVKRARHDRGLTLRELARAADIPVSSLSRIEADRGSSPSISVLGPIARALRVDPASLLGAECLSQGGRQEARPPGKQAEHLLGAFELLTQSQRQLVLTMVEELARSGTQPEDANAVAVESSEAEPPGDNDVRHYVQGWDRDTVRDNLDPGVSLVHAAGAQFSKPYLPMRRGDIIWIAYVDLGRLHIVGRMVIASRRDYESKLRSRAHLDDVVFSQREAESILGERDLWPAPEHLLAEAGTEEPIVDLGPLPTSLVKALRFRTSAGLTEVRFAGNGVSGQAFRSVRLLSPQSAGRFEAFWKERQTA